MPGLQHMVLWGALALPNFAHAVALTVSPQLPEGFSKAFWQRIDAPTLRHAIVKAGTPVQVTPGLHKMRVPCGEHSDKFAIITLNLQDKADHRIKYESCGVTHNSLETSM